MNILVIGNGFDLAHGLPTKYTDFLKFVEVINQVIEIKNNDDIRDKLYYDLNRFIRALEIYLADYVEKIECNRVSPDIEKMSFDKVLSFNYTKTSINRRKG